MGAVTSAGTLYAARILLGSFEAGFAPGVMLILSSWYKPAEQAKRFSIFYSAAVLSGAFGGIVAGAITLARRGSWYCWVAMAFRKLSD
jgi:MFS family permease